ncbi:MAG: cytochrome c biogenesis CcdA family protein [Acetivibrionales bacterium]|jgi:cytochrome c-type biogenesis protein
MNIYIISLLEGILTFVSPCILPLLPVYFFYLAGETGRNVSIQDYNKRRLIINSIGFVIGFTIIFVLLGAAATALGQFLKVHIGILRKISGIVMVIFGLNFMGILNIKLLNTEKRFEYKFKELRFINSIIFGVVFAFAWSPCMTAFLGSVLLMAGNSETLLQGVLLLFVYSIGLGIPFLLSSVILDRIRDSFKLIQRHSRLIRIISGIVLILAGLLVFTDRFKYLGAF